MNAESLVAVMALLVVFGTWIGVRAAGVKAQHDAHIQHGLAQIDLNRWRDGR